MTLNACVQKIVMKLNIFFLHSQYYSPPKGLEIRLDLQLTITEKFPPRPPSLHQLSVRQILGVSPPSNSGYRKPKSNKEKIKNEIYGLFLSKPVFFPDKKY